MRKKNRGGGGMELGMDWEERAGATNLLVNRGVEVD